MADSGALIKLALFGGAGYLAYRYLTAAPEQQQTVTGGNPPTAPLPTANTPPVAPGFNSLDAIYQRLAAAVGSQQLTADGFNVYLKNQLPSDKIPPSPTDVFTAAGWDRNAPMTLANYWGMVAPYLKANMGLSGLGMYGELYGAMRCGLYGYRGRR